LLYLQYFCWDVPLSLKISPPGVCFTTAVAQSKVT